MQRLQAAALDTSPSPNRLDISKGIVSKGSIKERISHILGVINNTQRPRTNMLFFIMYDISSHKVRRLVRKYLEDKGCTWVQRSIFLADLSRDVYETIRNDLTAVQNAYENKDSIMVVPVSTDNIRSMKVIGKALDIELICHEKHTMVF